VSNVPGYLTVDWTLAWAPTPKLHASLTVQSANDAERLEFGDGRLIEAARSRGLPGTSEGVCCRPELRLGRYVLLGS
jgi:hypothetical protein